MDLAYDWPQRFFYFHCVFRSRGRYGRGLARTVYSELPSSWVDNDNSRELRRLNAELVCVDLRIRPHGTRARGPAPGCAVVRRVEKNCDWSAFRAEKLSRRVGCHLREGILVLNPSEKGVDVAEDRKVRLDRGRYAGAT